MPKPDTRRERHYPRVPPSSGAAAKAQIISDAGRPAIACKLIDYSRGGACLEIFPMVPLPQRFELLYGDVKRKSRLVWRRGIRVGVAF